MVLVAIVTFIVSLVVLAQAIEGLTKVARLKELEREMFNREMDEMVKRCGFED